MRATSVLGRWALLVVLALGVVMMHHAPTHHEHPSQAAASPSISAPHDAKPVAAAQHSDCDCTAIAAPVFDSGHESPLLHLLIHLCLAIVTGFVATVLAFLVLWRVPLSDRVRSLVRSRIRSGQHSPPIPVPRRLAALCVLRL